MNARKLGMKVLGSLMAVAALSTLSGCIVVARPVPARRGAVTQPAPTYETPTARATVVIR